MLWTTFDFGKKRIPKWARTFGIDDNDRVFVPAAVGGPEMTVWLCASYDGVPACVRNKHWYFPVEWIAENYPATKQFCDETKARMLEIKAEHQSPTSNG